MEINDFLKIEDKYNLLNVEIEGVKVWRYMRFSIWNYKICTEAFNLSASHPKAGRNYLQTFKNMMYILHNSFSKRRIASKQYDICFVSHERRVKIGNCYECIYTEHLSETFKNSITIEQPFGYDHLKPTKNKNIVYTDYIIWAGEISCALNIRLKTKKYRYILEQIMQTFGDPIEELEKLYDIKLNKTNLYEIMARKVLAIKKERPYYRKLIKKISPALIVEVEHYGTQCMIINEIASDIGIRTIELQHGTMYREHAAYQYGTEQKIEQLPKMLFTFSEYWNEIIKLPLKSTEVVATGFPYFEDRLNRVKKESVEKAQKINILFISQGTISKQLASLALELNKKLDKNKFSIIYKLHPSEFDGWIQRLPELEQSDIVVADNSEINLYELFAESRVQVGVYSTAIYEGIGFGLETYIYNIAHADAMKKLVEIGAAEYVESADELLDKLSSGKNAKKIKEILWKSNAFENICGEVNRLLTNDKKI